MLSATTESQLQIKPLFASSALKSPYQLQSAIEATVTPRVLPDELFTE